MKPLLALILLGQVLVTPQSNAPRLTDAVRDFPRSQLSPRFSGPVSIAAKQNTRAAFRTIAEASGLNVVFDPDLRDSPISTAIEKAGVVEALDLVARQTGAFVEVLDEKTIIVAPENVAKRREYEMQVMRAFRMGSAAMPGNLSSIVTALRSALQARFLMSNMAANAVVIRDTPDRIVTAEQIIAELDRSSGGLVQPAFIAWNASRDIVVLQSGRSQRLAPGGSSLQVTRTGRFSFSLDQTSREAFETLARTAGINVIFDQDFRSTPVDFRVDDVGTLDALNHLALQTRSFWSPVDARTIIVAPDNQNKRRSFDRQLVKTFQLPGASSLELREIVTALRTLLNLRFVATAASSGALAIRDTPFYLALAEKLITDLAGRAPMVSTEIPVGAEHNFVLSRRAGRSMQSSQSPSQAADAGPLTFDLNENARKSYEEIASRAGLRVVFDSRFKEGAVTPFKVENVSAMDALDFVSLQTGNIWEVLDNNTITVGPHDPSVRNDLERRVTKTIPVSNAQEQNLTEIVSALRTLFNLTRLETAGGSLVVNDTDANIAFAERIVAELDRISKQ